MKIFSKNFFILSLASASFYLEATNIEWNFNQSTKQNYEFYKCPCEDGPKDKQLIVENRGNKVVKDILPFINKQTLFTLESLHQKLDESSFPIHALYDLWTRSVVLIESAPDTQLDPLYILNFKGSCNKKEYLSSFITLCHQLGIRTRPVVKEGNPCFDFCYKEGVWELFDPIEKKFYLGIDNQSFASSEEIMDDPLILLRAKTSRIENEIDFNKTYEELAKFQIINGYRAEENDADVQSIKNGSAGFDLYPGEKLVYGSMDASIDLGNNQCVMNHVLQPSYRTGVQTYHSPFPIKQITNQTDVTWTLIDSQTQLKSGESFTFSADYLFELNLVPNKAASKGTLKVVSISSQSILPSMVEGQNTIELGVLDNPSSIHITYNFENNIEANGHYLTITNPTNIFDQLPVTFTLEADPGDQVQAIWWQISQDPQFTVIPTNFEAQNIPFSNTLTLPPATESLLLNNACYYFRIKALVDGQWGQWSTHYYFIVNKPDPVTFIEFDKMGENSYEISWKPVDGQAVEYLVFGSNSLDFIPSVYSTAQINAIVDGEVVDQSTNDNLIATTTETKIDVDGRLAYYRIIARDKNVMSSPSRLIHVYDDNLIHPRNVLQLVKSGKQMVVKRIDIPLSEERTEALFSELVTKKPRITPEQAIAQLHSQVARTLDANDGQIYKQNSHIPNDVWEMAKPYFLPENHPVRPQLDRIFSSSRVLQNPDTFRMAGFKRWKPGRVSHIFASSNPQLKGVFIKGFPDNDTMVKADHKKLIHRIEGARAVRESINKFGYQKKFTVPNKWLYPLPENPSPPNSSKYIRRNFILVAEDMNILDQEKNNKSYKKKMTTSLMDKLYTIINDVGLYDSVYAFNVPFTKDGKLAFIDTEWHHRWPIPYGRFTKYFSKDKKKYWEKLIEQGGPKKKN